jgi:hypothetical protein
LEFSKGAKNIRDKGDPTVDPNDMRIIEEYFRILLNKVIEDKRHKVVKKPSIADGSVQAFLTALSNDQSYASLEEIELLNKAVCAAIDNPQDYFRIYEEEGSERGIDEPISGLFEFVLLDGLLKMHRAAELDWKNELDDTAGSIQQVSGEKGFDFSSLPQDTLDTRSALRAIDAQLVKRGKSLLLWDIDSDSCVVIVIRQGSLGEILKAAKKLKLKIAPFSISSAVG